MLNKYGLRLGPMKQNLLLLLSCIIVAAKAQTPPAMVKDVYPGGGDGILADTYLAELNGKAYFFGHPNDSTYWLYESDGTDAGTVPIAKARYYDYNEPNFHKWNNKLIWVGNDHTQWDNNQLMVSDGTSGGTEPVIQVNASTAVNSWKGDGFAALPGGFFMILIDSSESCLFFSDGTPAGTKRVFRPTGTVYYSFDLYNVVNGKLVFNINNDVYVSDGTPAGTQIAYSPSFFEHPGKGIVLGNYAYFSYGNDLWRTDGTTNGTTLVKGPFDSDPQLLAAAGNQLFFVSSENGSGAELFVSDGTTNGTHLVKDINPNGSGIMAAEPLLGVIGNKIVFVGNTLTEGDDPWISDGTAAGTFLLNEICTGTGSSYIQMPATDTVKGFVYFIAEQCNQAEQLYRTDGTTAGTIKVNSVNIGTSAFTTLRPINGLLYFSTIASGIGHEMFVTNGYPGGTITYDLVPGSGYSNSSEFTLVGNKVFFTASNNKGEELWSSDIPVISGVEETPADEMSAILFPNPANQLLIVKAGTLSIDKVNIYNASGQLLLTTGSSKIDVSLLNAGIYYAEVITSEGLLRNRFIKQ